MYHGTNFGGQATHKPGRISWDGSFCSAASDTDDAIEACGIDARARVETSRGPVAAADLQPGDELPDGRGSFNRVAATLRPVSVLGRDRIEISAGALGPDTPLHNIFLDPAQRIFVTSCVADRLAGPGGAFVQAMDLLGLPGVTLTPAIVSQTVHVVFDQHGTLTCEGLCLEGLVPTEAFLNALDHDQSESLHAALPKLRYASGLATYLHAIPMLDAREVLRVMRDGVAFAPSGDETILKRPNQVAMLTLKSAMAPALHADRSEAAARP